MTYHLRVMSPLFGWKVDKMTPWSCLWGLPASATCSYTVKQRPVETCRPCAGPSPTKHTGYTAYCPLPQKPKHTRDAESALLFDAKPQTSKSSLLRTAPWCIIPPGTLVQN